MDSMDNATEYEAYHQRWLAVPGDHAPGRLLNFGQWQALCQELAMLTGHREHENASTAKRVRQLQWALLVEPGS